METKTLSQSALNVIDQYLNFKFGPAISSVPYFNNKTARTRAALRTHIGKGSPKDIREELETLIIKNHLDQNALTSESLKKILVDNNLGIECSGFAYQVLEAESQERGRGALSKRLSFINCKGLLGKIRCSLRPIENCDVATFADDANSHTIPLNEIAAGDIIIMVSSDMSNESAERNHILVVHEVLTMSDIVKISYTHSVAYPEDGVYGTGVRQGYIEISDTNKPITEAKWVEGNKEGLSNILFIRAKKSKTEVRRLK